MSNIPETPDEIARLRAVLADDVRSFLLSKLAWNRMQPDSRNRLRKVLGLNVKHVRRPTHLVVSPVDDDMQPIEPDNRCSIGAEGVMSHYDEEFIHLAFKCGNPSHRYHYSTFGVPTVIALAQACEASWPGSISGCLNASRESGMADEEKPIALDDGDDDFDLDDSTDDDRRIDGSK